MTTRVRTDLAAYRAAIAELPLRAAATEEPAGSVAVVHGDGAWGEAAADAIARGAAAVVIARPGVATLTAIDALAAAVGDVPLVVERPLLRPDVVATVDAALPGLPDPAAVTIECHAPAAALGTALRDAIGWAHVITRAPLTCAAADTREGRALALLETAGGVPVSLIAATQAGAPPQGRVRVVALGETLVEIDDDGDDVVVTMTDAGGRRTAPLRYERPERVALRRAIEAVGAGRAVADLDELRRDAQLAEAALAGLGNTAQEVL